LRATMPGVVGARRAVPRSPPRHGTPCPYKCQTCSAPRRLARAASRLVILTGTCSLFSDNAETCSRAKPVLPRRRVLRLQNYDYTQAGAYFVTVCAWNRACRFGDMMDNTVQLTVQGQIVAEEWAQTAVRRPGVDLDGFVVMPNHIHGIIVLPDSAHPPNARPSTERFGKPVAGSLPTIVRAFKSAVARRISRLPGAGGTAVWPANYYEHIIRDEAELARVREYIVNNPARWVDDEDYPYGV